MDRVSDVQGVVNDPFAEMTPIAPVPVSPDDIPFGPQPEPRYWRYRIG